MSDSVERLSGVPTEQIPPGLPREVEKALMAAAEQGYETADVEIHKDAAGVSVKVVPVGEPKPDLDGSYETDTNPDTEPRCCEYCTGIGCDCDDDSGACECCWGCTSSPVDGKGDDDDCANPDCILPFLHSGPCEGKHAGKGAMIALYPAVVPEGLTLADGEDADDLHVTLAYIEPQNCTERVRLALIGAAARIAMRGDTLTGTVAGVGRFMNVEDDKDAIWAAVDVPGLDRLRHEVSEAMERAQISCSTKHGWTPHMTLAYVAPDAMTPRTPTGDPLIFNRLTIKIGDERIDLPLDADDGIVTDSLPPAEYAVAKSGPTVTDVHQDAAGAAPRPKRKHIKGCACDDCPGPLTDKSVTGDYTAVRKEAERRFTLGPWYIPDVMDGHGHWTDSNTLQEALWGYVRAGDRQVYLQHNQKVVAGEWVEAVTWPVAVNLPLVQADGTAVDHEFPAGTVFVGIVWKPWAWDLVKTGKVTGLSVGGRAVVGQEVQDVEGADQIAKANPYHDSLGRFAPRGGGGIGLGNGGAARPGMGDIALDPQTLAELKSTGSTSAKHIKGGRFTAERQALHDKIIEKHLAGIERNGGDPQFHMLGGGPAAGKSTALREGRFRSVPGEGKAAMVDSDRLKHDLPEVKSMISGGDKDWAGKGHMESMYLARRLHMAAVERGLDVVMDGTGDSLPKYISEKIHAARAHGYKVQGHYVTVPTEVALGRSTRRAQTEGRHLPPKVVERLHAGVSYTLPRVAHEFDSVDLVDMARGGKVIAKAVRGSGLRPTDSEGAQALKEFLDKAKGYNA